MRTTKKAISAVIAISLLVVISVSSVVFLQDWFGLFQDQLLLKTELGSEKTSGSGIKEMVGTTVYFYNDQTENISMVEMIIEDTDCQINQELTPGMNLIDIESCIFSKGGQDIYIRTPTKLYETRIYATSSNY